MADENQGAARLGNYLKGIYIITLAQFTIIYWKGFMNIGFALK
jgi:hypothetical protein